MGNIVVLRDLYDPALAQVVPYKGALIDYLQVTWPEGFNDATVRIFLNSKELVVADYDSEIRDGDICTIMYAPQDPITLTLMWAAVQTFGAYLVSTQFLTYVALSLASAVISSLFAPKQPKSQSAAKTVYEVQGQQNQLALGSVIPEHYGTCWFMPTYASQPYVKFINGDQYLYQIMLISAGYARLDELSLGSANIDSFTDGTITYGWVLPSDHNGELGYISTTFGIDEDVVSSSEVQSIDLSRNSQTSFFGKAYADDNYYKGKEANSFIKVNDSVTILGNSDAERNHNTQTRVTSNSGTTIRVQADVINDAGNPWYQIVKDDDGWRGWFDACPATKTTNKLEVDFVFPNGIFWTDSDGDFRRYTVNIFVEFQPIDEYGNTIGSSQIRKYVYSAASRNPKRSTESFTVPEGRYRVRVKRDTRDDAYTGESSKGYWAGLKAYCNHPAGTKAYGESTLLVMIVKATQAVAEAQLTKVTCKATRVLPSVPSNFGVSVPTTNPTDAFAHIVMSGSNAVDGLDMVNLTELHTKWLNTNGFNYRFESQSTVFDALQLVAANHRATPVAYAKQIGMRLDRLQQYDKFLITNEQMSEGSYSLGIKLGVDDLTDSYRVLYQDPNSLLILSVMWPLEGSTPEEIRMFGCTDQQTAIQQSKYMWEKRQALRRMVEFNSEFDPHCYSVGDRIGVVHPTIDWLSVARVIGVNGLELMLDNSYVSIGEVRVKLRTETGEVTNLLTGEINGNILTLGTPPGIPIYTELDGREATTVVLGQTTHFRRSYMVTDINPSSTGIAVKAIGYSETEFQFPIPGEAI